MTTVLFTLIVIPIVLVLYLYYLAGLTRRADFAMLLSLEGTSAGMVLRILESRSHAKDMQRLTPQERRLFGRDFVGGLMPQLFREAQRVTMAARHPVVLWHFSLFCLAYAFVWVKLRIWAEVEDVRYLVGAEASLLRTAGAAE